MQLYWKVVTYEFGMSIRRKGLWLAFGCLFLFYGITSLSGGPLRLPGKLVTTADLWKTAAQIAFSLNLFAPVVAGISAADRLVRDSQLGVDELFHSTALKSGVYLAGKYTGVLLSLLIPVLLLVLMICVSDVARGAPPALLPMSLAAFLGMSVPAIAFVTAFGLGCPTIMPVRVFQVLFTGYWFWGNYLNPDVFPTIAGSLLTANGRIAQEGWFGGWPGAEITQMTYSSTDVAINLALLACLAAAALVVTGRVLAWRAGRA